MSFTAAKNRVLLKAPSSGNKISFIIQMGFNMRTQFYAELIGQSLHFCDILFRYIDID